MSYATSYIVDASKQEAWQRVSSTRLRKKIVSTYTKVFVGFGSRREAEEELETRIKMYSNVFEGQVKHSGGGMWEMQYTFKTSEWCVPAVYKDG